NPDTGKALFVLNGHIPKADVNFAFSPNGTFLATADNYIHLWNTANGKRVRSFQVESKAQVAIAFSPDGRTLAAGGTDRVVRILEVASGKERLTLTGHGPYP